MNYTVNMISFFPLLQMTKVRSSLSESICRRHSNAYYNWKTLREKVKMLVTNIFTLSPNVSRSLPYRIRNLRIHELMGRGENARYRPYCPFPTTFSEA